MWQSLVCFIHLICQFESQFIGSLAFYFNFKSSILGELIGEKRSDIVPHVHFIATPLLPCGKADSKIQKFTGHNEVGPATDDITKAIHAFAHFSLVYSHEHLVFCDLQGSEACNPNVTLLTLACNRYL